MENQTIEKPSYVNDSLWDYAIQVWGSPQEALEFLNRMVSLSDPDIRVLVERIEKTPFDQEARQHLHRILFERLLSIEEGLPA